jgi:hypothetical protein
VAARDTCRHRELLPERQVFQKQAST